MNEVVIGLDPGTATTGYGVVCLENGKLTHRGHGCITTEKTVPAAERLVSIRIQLLKLIGEFNPAAVAVEQLYFFKNVTTAIPVAQARGVMLETVAGLGIPVISYTPLQVKMALTGYGRADKAQMQKMIRMVLGLSEIPTPDDAADALAIAITHIHSAKFNSLAK